MRQTRILMGMPITVEVLDNDSKAIEAVYAYFEAIDCRFSTYKSDSEISRINRGELLSADYSSEMKEVLALCEETKRLTDGYFDIALRGGMTTPAVPKPPAGMIQLEPSGLVKGWAIQRAAELLRSRGLGTFLC